MTDVPAAAQRTVGEAARRCNCTVAGRVPRGSRVTGVRSARARAVGPTRRRLLARSHDALRAPGDTASGHARRMTISAYKNRKLPPERKLCLVCQLKTRLPVVEVHLDYGVSVQLCTIHASRAFQSMRHGKDFVVTIERAWEAANCLTPKRRKALEAHRDRFRRRPAAARHGRSAASPAPTTGSTCAASSSVAPRRASAGQHHPRPARASPSTTSPTCRRSARCVAGIARLGGSRACARDPARLRTPRRGTCRAARSASTPTRPGGSGSVRPRRAAAADATSTLARAAARA